MMDCRFAIADFADCVSRVAKVVRWSAECWGEELTTKDTKEKQTRTGTEELQHRVRRNVLKG